MSELTRQILLQNMRQDEGDRERAIQSEMALLQQAAELGRSKDVRALSPFLKNLSPSMVDAWATAADLNTKMKAEREAIGEVTNPEDLKNLGKTVAPMPGPQGRLVSPPADAMGALSAELNRRTSQLSETGRMDLYPGMMSQVNLGALGTGQAAREVLADEQRAEGRAIRTERRATLEDERTARVAALSEVLSGPREDDGRRLNALMADVLASDPNGFDKTMRVARIEAEGKHAKYAREFLSAAQGPTDRQSETQAIKRLRANGMSEYPERDYDEATLLASKKGFIDPLTNRVLISSDKGYKDKRAAMAEIEPLVDALEDSILTMAEEARTGKLITAGGFLGAQKLQEFARAAVIESRGVAEFTTLQKQLAIKLARIDQQGTLSNQDISILVAGMIGLPDISFDENGQLSPQAIGRMNALRTQIEVAKKIVPGETTGPVLRNLQDPRMRRLRAMFQRDGLKFDVDRAVEIMNMPPERSGATKAERAAAGIDQFMRETGP